MYNQNIKCSLLNHIMEELWIIEYANFRHAVDTTHIFRFLPSWELGSDETREGEKSLKKNKKKKEKCHHLIPLIEFTSMESWIMHLNYINFRIESSKVRLWRKDYRYNTFTTIMAITPHTIRKRNSMIHLSVATWETQTLFCNQTNKNLKKST